MIQDDQWMIRWFERIQKWSISFGGCTYITAPFEMRIERHRQDVAKKCTNKQENLRFLNYNQDAFLQWDNHLLQLLTAHIPHVQSISSACLSPEAMAEQIIAHIEYCREQGAIP
ncbi:MAG: hypothetical protein WCD86_14305 [Ktedonobacteraceae bacterium]